MAEFDGKVILITGSATGLGAALAVEVAQRGARAVIVNAARSLQEAEETAAAVRKAGAESSVVQGDVSEDADCRRIAEAAARYGRLDVLVNNAGTSKHVPHGDLDGLSKDDFLKIYAVNTVGPFQMVRACRGLLEASPSGNVLMTSSIAGVMGSGSSVAYASSKGALNTMTLSLARALAPKIRVNAICPGFIETRWFRQGLGEEKAEQYKDRVAETTPLKRAGKTEDVVGPAMFLMSDAARHITGETLLIDAGMHLGAAPLKAR